MLYVLGLVAGFASFWFVVAALQTFDAAQPARLTNIVAAVGTAALAVLLFWAARRFGRAAAQETTANGALDGRETQ